MPLPHPPEILTLARALRASGESVKRIAAELGVSVAWVSVAVRDVELTEEQRADLYSYRRGARALGQVVRSAGYRERRLSAQERGRTLAREADPDFVSGCMLHWAEGAKDRNKLGLTNADPELVAYWVGWLRRWIVTSDDQIVLRVNVHLGNGLSLREIEVWWLERLGLPDACLRRSVVNRASRASKGVRRPLTYGTMHIDVYSTAAVQMVFGGIQEHAGFSRPEWLDMGTVAPRADAA